MKFPAACVNDIITWDFKQNIEIHADKLSLVQPLNCQSLSHYIERGGRKSPGTTIGFSRAMGRSSAKLGNACATPYTHTLSLLRMAARGGWIILRNFQPTKLIVVYIVRALRRLRKRGFFSCRKSRFIA